MRKLERQRSAADLKSNPQARLANKPTIRAPDPIAFAAAAKALG